MPTDKKTEPEQNIIQRLCNLGGFAPKSMYGKKLVRIYTKQLTSQQCRLLREGTDEECLGWLNDTILTGNAREEDDANMRARADFKPLGDRVHEAQRHTKHALGCFQAAEDDEPIFTLRAKDAFAPMLVLQWVTLVEASTDREALDAMTGEAMAHFNAKLDDARHCARTMVEWQRSNTHKLPD